MASRDDTLAQFQSMTGAEDEFAISFLEAANWSLDSAVELWFGANAAPSSSSSSNTNNNNNHRTQEYAYGTRQGDDDDDDDVIMADDDDEDEVSYAGGGSKLSDEAEAAIRSLMESAQVDRATAKAIYQAGGGGSSNAPGGGAGDGGGGVRAPILQKRARLFDVGGGGDDDDDDDDDEAAYGRGGGGGGLSVSAVEAQMRLLRASFPQQHSEEDVTPSQPSMFAPPRWMMFVGTFEEARLKAKTNGRWLLVNLQEEREFQSLVLNRDLWTNEVCQALVRESFVFWQVERSSSQAQRFIQLYNPAGPFPVCCIVDPRTGEQVQLLKLKRTEDDLREAFIEQVTTFCDSRGMPTATSSQRQQAPSPVPPAAFTTTAAAAAPAGTLPTPPPAAAVVDTARTLGGERTPQVRLSAAHKTEELAPEPDAKDANGTPICFKLPNNKRVTRRFLKTSKLSVLFAYIHQTHAGELGGGGGASFDLVASGPPASVLTDLDATVLDKNLCGSVVMVRLRD